MLCLRIHVSPWFSVRSKVSHPCSTIFICGAGRVSPCCKPNTQAPRVVLVAGTCIVLSLFHSPFVVSDPQLIPMPKPS